MRQEAEYLFRPYMYDSNLVVKYQMDLYVDSLA